MSVINKNVKNALIELNPNIKDIIMDINTDTGVSRLDVFNLGITLGGLHIIQAAHSLYNVREDEIAESIKNIKEFLSKY